MTDQNQPPAGGQPWDAQPPADQPVSDPYGQPSAYGQPPATDPYGQPVAGAYAQPPAPDPYAQPAPAPYGQPAPGAYGAPQGAAPGYGMQQSYGGPAPYNPASAVNNVKLNYWLSVFFTWIPALIFYLTDKDKNQVLDDHLKENMNFQITRVIAWAVMIVPYIGWLVGGLASLALFIIAILGAMKGTEAFQRGQTYRYPFAIRFIK